MFSYGHSDKKHQRTHDHNIYICLICLISYPHVSSNDTLENFFEYKKSYIDCIYLAFLQCGSLYELLGHEQNMPSIYIEYIYVNHCHCVVSCELSHSWHYLLHIHIGYICGSFLHAVSYAFSGMLSLRRCNCTGCTCAHFLGCAISYVPSNCRQLII